MRISVSSLDASAVEEVSIELWRGLFEAVGWPSSLTSRRESFSYDELESALEQDDLSDGLLEALEVLRTLGTESGRDAISIAMRDRRIEPDAITLPDGDREAALSLFLAQRSDVALSGVLERAQAEIQDGSDERKYSEFMGKTAQPIKGGVHTKKAPLEEAARVYCIKNGFADHVAVRAFEDEGISVFQVIRGHRAKKPLAVLPGTTGRATITFYPVHTDVLRYDANVGRLRVAARAGSVVEFYKQMLGNVLFGDSAFFTAEPICSLEVLQKKGRVVLETVNLPGITHARMTECLWERADGELLHIRSKDCFRHVQELGLPLHEGTLLHAKIKLNVVGRSTRPVTVNVRVPHTIAVSNRRHEQLVDEALTAMGIRNARAPRKEHDLWCLYPWRHPDSIWRAVFGALTDRLVQERVLVPVELGSVSSPGYPAAGRVLAAETLPDGEVYGVSRVPEVSSRSLTRTDVAGLSLDPEALQRFLRAHLKLTGPFVSWDHGELLDLGLVELDTARIRLSYALRAATQGHRPGVLGRAKGDHPCVFNPTATPHSFEIQDVATGGPIPDREDLVRALVAALGLRGKVSAVHGAPKHTRLVVDTQFRKIWIDGIEILEIEGESQPFRLVEALAKAGGKPVPTKELAATLSPNRGDDTTVARQAKNAAKEKIEAAMERAGHALDDDPFPAQPAKHYRCALPSYVE